MELLDHIVVNIFHFLRNFSFNFFIAAAPIYIPTNNAWGFPFLQILTNTCSLCLFDDSHSNTHEDIAHCGFDLLSQMINGVDHLFICLLAIWMFSEKCNRHLRKEDYTMEKRQILWQNVLGKTRKGYLLYDSNHIMVWKWQNCEDNKKIVGCPGLKG